MRRHECLELFGLRLRMATAVPAWRARRLLRVERELRSPIRCGRRRGRGTLAVLMQSGFGVTEDRGGFKFLMAGVHAGKVLTGMLGTG